jgi:hypothetical protein
VCALLTTAAALGAGLAGCGDSAAAGLAHQACQHVEQSLRLYRTSLEQTDARQAAGDRSRASAQLQAAAPIAAVAAGQDSQWQALMATLAESSRLPESDLTHALQAQCAAVDSGDMTGPTLPPTTLPPTTLPPPPNPSGPS